MADSYIIAIDFGTAYSGYAFNITPSAEDTDPHLKMWGKEVGFNTPKTPTCILFDDSEEFMNFGYEAVERYKKMGGKEAKKYHFFENFKMALYGTEIKRDLKIKSANGKEMMALKVFKEALRFLKEDALKTITLNTAGMVFLASDFTWVLTVPAIWEESAKQFMREAAVQAGIVEDGNEERLVIALEPEAASIWCKKLPSDGFITEKHNCTPLDECLGTRYIVIDCGGGTIDITVHEVVEEGALKELHKASGNNLGGQTVDKKFKEFLKEIFCDGIWEEYEENYPNEVQKLMYDFTRLKQVDDDVQFICPFNLGSLILKKKDIEKSFESVEGAFWVEGSIKISKEKMRTFFQESLEGIAGNLKEILKKESKIDYILLVGGFANSQILLQYITDQFKDICSILCPFRAQEAILRGAIEFGRNPAWVASRKSAFTYGVAVCEPFLELVHKPEKKLMIGKEEWCSDMFMTLVKAGEDVSWNETRKHILSPVNKYQTWMSMRFFRTERLFAKFVDDLGVYDIGSFDVEMPDINGGRERQVKLEIRFGSTEITATATDMNTGSKGSIQFDFIGKDDLRGLDTCWYFCSDEKTLPE
ncbi:PREDICTED: heat shock 70 kDa protein 12A-like [Cyprinodon variegatus]|uniref:heat shock 70 kDa protein 12A-like n=1 Tax=Cyprinodon variegatus TaxID=28743 RepID=UPI000742CA36|nr:PREDICTED: heat shock 70 kDa protein 12A-like [Cyprinodon variegatus]